MRRKQRTLTNSNECDVIGQRTSGVFAHALNQLRCNGTPVYAMIDSRQIDLQLSFVQPAKPGFMVISTKTIEHVRLFFQWGH